MRRTGRWYLAVTVAVLMVVLNFNFWMAGAVHPIILGMPILFFYHVMYVFVSVVALWIIFSAIWPQEPEEY